MGNIVTPDSVAAVNAVGAKNTQFAPLITNVEQKILIIGAGLAAKEDTYTPNVPKRMYSPDQGGALYGMGGPIHRALLAAWKGHGGAIATYVAPQEESGTGAAAAGEIEITHVATESGFLHLYIAGEHYPIQVTADMTLTDIGDDIVAAMAARPECPLTGVNAAGTVTLTCKSLGTWGNDVSVTSKELSTQEDPDGLAYTITPMASGANDPDVQDVLDELGTGDAANSDAFTRIVVCYGRLVEGNMDSLSEYNGTGDEMEGCYRETVHKPFLSLFGDTQGLADPGLDDLLVIGEARRELDRTNGVIAVPGSPNHPTDIAAMATGVMAKISNLRAAQSYVGQALPGILPGARANQWTTEYTNKDAACKAGISPTSVVNGVVKMQNMLTFYHPEAVPNSSNGYRSMRNVAITMNVLKNHYDNFNGESWQGISIVADAAKVTSTVDREKVKDINCFVADLFALVDLFEGKAWIYQAAWTKERIGNDLGSYVTIRAGGLGFNDILPLVYSGEGGMINGEVQFDINLAVITG
jgi:phage tail sheath gpL-like